MKYVISENLSVRFKGEFCSANEDEGQFIFDTDAEHQLSKATLIGIATANEVNFHKRDNVHTLVENIDQAFSEMKLDEVSKMSDDKIVEEIVLAGVEAGSNEDTMLVQIVNAGVSFKNALKLFHSVMEKKGLRISAKKRADKIAELIAELNFQPETTDDVKGMISTITKNVPATNDQQAYGVLRRWAKKNEVDMPKMRGAGGGGGAGGFRGKAEAWMVANPLASGEEFAKWVTSEDGGNKDEKAANRFLPWFTVAQKMAQAIADMPRDEAESEAA